MFEDLESGVGDAETEEEEVPEKRREKRMERECTSYSWRDGEMERDPKKKISEDDEKESEENEIVIT